MLLSNDLPDVDWGEMLESLMQVGSEIRPVGKSMKADAARIRPICDYSEHVCLPDVETVVNQLRAGKATWSARALNVFGIHPDELPSHAQMIRCRSADFYYAASLPGPD